MRRPRSTEAATAVTEPPERPEGEGRRTDPAGPPAVEVEDLHKSFGRLEVLSGVSLAARRGDVVALVGASGSGKSTLLRCINMLEVPTRGRVAIGGEAIALRPARHGEMRPADPAQVRRLRTRLGMVFQSFDLWQHRTLVENVMEVPVHVLGVRRDEARAKAEALLARVGLADKRDVYPAHLSGGQQQRGAIARALAVKPEVMLFDEPTSALDPELVGEVLAVIRDLAHEGRTMVLVTHEMRFAREVASEVVFLHRGGVEERGPPDAMFGAPRTERFRQFIRTTREGL